MSIEFITINSADPNADIGIFIDRVYRGMISEYAKPIHGKVVLDLVNHPASHHVSIELAKRHAIALLVAEKLGSP